MEDSTASIGDEGSHPRRFGLVNPARVPVAGVLGLTALAAAVAWLVATESSAPPLHAATFTGGRSGDLDGDGLADALELRLGTSPDGFDTDRDGFSDSEELARGSSPLDAGSIPDAAPLGVGLEVYQDGGPLQLVSLLYVGDGDPVSKTVSMGARVGSIVRKAPPAFFTAKACITALPGDEAGSTVIVIDAPVDPLLVHRFGSLSFFTTLADQGKVSAAGVANVIWKDGLLLEYVVEPASSGPAPTRATNEPGSVGHYEPIDPNAVPADWLPDQICVQSMMIAASIGPVIIQEVVAAECEEGWEAYCDPGCPATVGTTVETLDPGALIGG